MDGFSLVGKKLEDVSDVDFYQKLPVIAHFSAAMETSLHADLPADWWVVIADVIGSTKAIEAGEYKKVNTVGVACIAAVVNVDRDIELPFVFGGDGATFAIPELMRESVIEALRAAQHMSLLSFGLELRVGLVSVRDLVSQGFYVRVAKVELSSFVRQALFSGRGWEEAEKRIKNNEAGVLRVIPNGGVAHGSFEGFECRWQKVPSFKDHKLALLVAAMSHDSNINYATYQRVLERIAQIYGDVEQYHPLRPDEMRLSFNLKELVCEWKVRSSTSSKLKKLQYLLKMILQNAAGYILFSKKMDTKAVKWSHYRNELVDNSDYRKFDCMLRMVIDGSHHQALALSKFLEAEYQQGLLVYGMHESESALVTCIVQSYNGNHMHFVDGGDGGYAYAAKGFKMRLSALKSRVKQ